MSPRLRPSLLALLALASCTGWDSHADPYPMRIGAPARDFPWQARCADVLEEAATQVASEDRKFGQPTLTFMSLPGDNYTYHAVELHAGSWDGVTLKVTRRDPPIAEDHPDGWQLDQERAWQHKRTWRREGPFTTAELTMGGLDSPQTQPVLARLRVAADRCIDAPADS